MHWQNCKEKHQQKPNSKGLVKCGNELRSCHPHSQKLFVARIVNGSKVLSA